MTEQIYINDVLMDRTDGKAVSLVFQSQLFTDIDSIVSNRTNAVEFPATKKNLSAVGNPQMAGSKSEFAYRKHRAVYLRDGVQIFSGFGTLLSVSGTSIKFSFTWGNVSVFKKLLDYKLREIRTQLNEEDIHLPWNDSAVTSNAYYPANVETGAYRHPAMKVSTILSEITRLCGVVFENKERLTDYRIPVTGKTADDFAKRQQGVILGGNLSSRIQTYQYHYSLAVGSGDKDVRKLYKENGIFDISGIKTLKIEFGADFRYSMPAYSGNSEQQITIYAVTEDGKFSSQLSHLKLYKTTTGARFVYSTSSGLAEKKEITLNVEDYTHLRIEICTVGTSQSSTTPSVISGSVNIIPDYDEEQELIYGGVYPIFQNLPDWTVSQLLKNLMKMEGLFAVCPDENTIRFVSVDDVYSNRSKAIDVTSRLIFKDGAPTERSFTYGQYAKRNYFRYAEDETVKTNGDGVMIISDENLDAEKEVLKLDFAASDMSSQVVQIPLYTKDDSGEVTYNDVKPRVLRLEGIAPNGQEMLTFKGLEWTSLINANYSGFSRCLSNAKIIKSSILTDSIELSKLDLTVPVYAFSLGHYYVILKMTTKDSGAADIEILQLNESAIILDDGAAPELAVVSNGNGGYCATLTNKTQAEIQSYISDERYKVCLVRYGYARRGKFFKYKDKTGKETNSKTCRTAKRNLEAPEFGGWRSVRREKGGGTPCWRIIGDELLRTGKIAQNSQTMKKYGDASLVFDLGDAMTLPAIPSRAKTKSGRISNRASDGISELSIAMYRNEGNGKWKRVSNICPVRSRTDSKQEYWDFEPRNARLL